MSTKTKPPSHPSQARSRAPSPASSAKPPLPQADNRWQRTVRYGWDKGGARGGRK